MRVENNTKYRWYCNLNSFFAVYFIHHIKVSSLEYAKTRITVQYLFVKIYIIAIKYNTTMNNANK